MFVMAVALSVIEPLCAQAPVQSSMSNGGVHEAEYDAEGRPITAGGFVESGQAVFQDVTKSAGLSGWRHVMGGPEKTFILESNGSGVGLIDYDNEGWLDIYIGQRFHIQRPRWQGNPAPRRALSQQSRRDVYRRDGEGRRGQ